MLGNNEIQDMIEDRIQSKLDSLVEKVHQHDYEGNDEMEEFENDLVVAAGLGDGGCRSLLADLIESMQN